MVILIVMCMCCGLILYVWMLICIMILRLLRIVVYLVMGVFEYYIVFVWYEMLVVIDKDVLFG